MRKKYSYIFSNIFRKKSSSRKYSKRKKNLFQKICKKLSFISHIPIGVGILIIGIIITIIGFFILFSSQYTSISHINIYRQGALIDINRAYNIVDYLRGKNLFTIQEQEISQRLKKSQASISEITINKDLPNSIDIFLDSYDVIFQTENHFILKNGSIIPKQNIEFPLAPFIHLSRDISEYIEFQKKINTQELEAIDGLLKESSKNILGFIPEEVYYFIKEREVGIRDNLGTLYIFDIERNINEQIKQIAIYDTESTQIKRDSYIYIDVRISDKLFLCSRELEATCNNNLQQIYGDTIFYRRLSKASESLQ